MEKKYMLHFFHERNYEPQSLQAFEREAVQAAQAGKQAEIRFWWKNGM